MAASAKRAKLVNIRDPAAVAAFIAQSLEWIERYLKNSPEDFHQYAEVSLTALVRCLHVPHNGWSDRCRD
jgi:hypothetical protein